MPEQIYKEIHPDALANRPLELYEIHLLERVAAEGGAVRIPVKNFSDFKKKDHEGIKAMIDCFRQLETRGYVLAETDDRRSEIRVTLLEPAIMLMEMRGCLKGQ